jgi:hypothetical protein
MPLRGQTSVPTARASVDSSQFLVGDWIHVRVDLQHPKGATFRALLADTSIGGFTIIERKPPLLTSDTTTQTTLVLAKYSAGEATLPPLPFAVSIPGDPAPRTVSTNALALTVNAVPVDTTKDFRDLKKPLSIPMTLAEMLLYAGSLLLLAACAYGAYRFWKRRALKRREAVDAYVAPARPAHLIALEQLAILREKKLWQQGLIKQYYSEITEIYRRYLENRYAMMAMEETTDEIMTGLRKLRFPDSMLDVAERILRRADLVKFAKHQPPITEHEEMFTVVQDFVVKTKIAQMTEPTPAEAKAALHAGS